MESLPPVTLGVIIFLAFLVALVVRKPLEGRLVLRAAEISQSKRQFFLDFCLCLLAGILATSYNTISFGFPAGSAGSLLIGCIVAGFFLSIDTALARERAVIHDAMDRRQELPAPERLFSMTKKFTLVALTTIFFVSTVIFLVFSRDIIWLSKIGQNETALSQAQLSVAYEMAFIFVVLLALVINLVVSYSRNLKLLFENETRVLERVSLGDLSQKVPIATQDEFGLIAGHTNSMIDGLRHRSEMIAALKLAEEVQQNLLPRKAPALAGLDIAGSSIYCDETGGDYFDYFRLGPDKLGIVVADAAGHGVGAAMHMTTVRAFLHFGVRNYDGPAQLLRDVNHYVTRDSYQTSRFMSMFFLEIASSAKTLRWVRAGHEPAMLFEPGSDTFRELSGEGVALGVVEDYDYVDSTMNGWAANSVMIIGTDGVHEARNASGQMFGLARLRETIRANATGSAAAIKDAVIGALRGFCGSKSQEDDITLVIVKLL